MLLVEEPAITLGVVAVKGVADTCCECSTVGVAVNPQIAITVLHCLVEQLH